MRKIFAIFVAQLVLGLCLLTLSASVSEAVTASNIVSSDGRTWEFVESGLAVDAVVYVDRAYVFTAIPDELVGLPYLKTTNDSKGEGDGLRITFDIDQPAFVYFGLIHSIAAKQWMEDGFEMVMEKAINASWTAGYECNVWRSKGAFQNTVTLGYAGDPLGMYCAVALKAADSTAVESSGKLSTTWGALKADR